MSSVSMVNVSVDRAFGQFSNTPSCSLSKQVINGLIQRFGGGNLSAVAFEQMHQEIRGITMSTPAKKSAHKAINSLQFQIAIKEKVTEYFGRHKNSPSHATVQRVIDQAFASSQDPADVLRTIDQNLDQLRSNPKGDSNGWLAEDPYRSAKAALRSIQSSPESGGLRRRRGSEEQKGAANGGHDATRAQASWQTCISRWTTGGREDAQSLNRVIFSQTLQDLRDRTGFDSAQFSRSLQGTQFFDTLSSGDVDGALARQGRGRGNYSTSIDLVEASTSDAARLMVKKGLKPLVLDMANKSDVGGAPHKASTQEEAGCREWTLYGNLQAVAQQTPNPDFNHCAHQYPSSIAGTQEVGGVLAPGVQIFREGPNEGWEYLSPAEVTTVDVFASAAFNCNPRLPVDRPQSETAYKSVTKEKMRVMFRAAIVNGNDSLLLSAFGCGAFQNDPDVIAHLYSEVLSEPEFKGQFKKVTFAIIGMGGSNQNLKAFKKVFAPGCCEQVMRFVRGLFTFGRG